MHFNASCYEHAAYYIPFMHALSSWLYDYVDTCVRLPSQDQINDDEEWEIRLRLMSAQDQPDLLLRFQDLQQYLTWKRGLALTLTLLFSPSGLAAGSLGDPTPAKGHASLSKSRAEIVQQLLEATNESGGPYTLVVMALQP